MEAFACVPAPLGLKAVTTHRTPQSSPFWSRPHFTVRQPENGEDYGVRRGVAALDSQRSGGDSANAPLSTAPPRDAGKDQPGGRGREAPLRQRLVPSPSGLIFARMLRASLENGGFRLFSRSAGIESGDNSPHSTIVPVLKQAAFHRAPAWRQGGLWSASPRRRCFPAPLALKAVTTHRTPQSSPFWSRPRFSVRQPENGEDYGVRRGVAALGSQRSWGDSANAPLSTAPPQGVGKNPPGGRGREAPLRQRLVPSPSGRG
jgi:hypothetical protein